MKLSHVDRRGKAHMVDVSAKAPQNRRAVAAGRIRLSAEARRLVRANQIKKGDVFAVAQIAGIAAAKRTSELIPLCHNIPLGQASVRCSWLKDGVEVQASATCVGQTGVEMEALTAVSVALLSIYDMCKAVDKGMVLSDIRLLEKVKW